MTSGKANAPKQKGASGARGRDLRPTKAALKTKSPAVAAVPEGSVLDRVVERLRR